MFTKLTKSNSPRVSSMLAVCALAAWNSGREALAISLTVEPASQTVAAGNTVGVEVRIAGLGNLTAPSLGTFDFHLDYNPAVLSFASVVFGDPVLGDLLNPGLSGSITDPVAGSVNLFELSMADVSTLNAAQPGSFILASLQFTALGTGSSPIGFSQIILGDADGNALVPDSVGSASVRVSGLSVPDGGGLTLPVLLLGAGWLLSGWRRNSYGNSASSA